ncbi:hypothetical protein SAMN05414137_113127 [Streptacidiphilus jiangxiensis]|uniref:Uncharacterized protein n=1 Tax=Streptacidiphilus jiangxiensis TaxID=235985 RepID=A0A1H7T7U1_STRJI|nr:hypothetical protein SAMN05414137_113127 [Streptacidiphilus jiangxiensis]
MNRLRVPVGLFGFGGEAARQRGRRPLTGAFTGAGP